MSKPLPSQSRFLMWGAAVFAFYACGAQWIGWSSQGMPVALPMALTLGVAVLLCWFARGERLPKSLFLAGSYGAVLTLAWAMGRPGFVYPGVSVSYGLSILGTMYVFSVFWLWSKDGVWTPNFKWVLVPMALLVLGAGMAFLSGDQGSAGPMVEWLRSFGLPAAGADAVTFVFRKGVHLVFYGLLAGLAYLWATYLGLNRKQLLLFAWAWGLGHAAFDEAHQLFTASRQGSIWDVLVNMAGMALALAWLTRRRA